MQFCSHHVQRIFLIMMADIYSTSKRAAIMAKISGKENKPEILVRKVLFASGFDTEKMISDILGSQILFFPDLKLQSL